MTCVGMSAVWIIIYDQTLLLSYYCHRFNIKNSTNNSLNDVRLLRSASTLFKVALAELLGRGLKMLTTDTTDMAVVGHRARDDT